jgi:two-component system cell cycle response regulator
MAQIESTNKPKATILLIDDSRVMRKAISRVLVEEFEVIEAEDGEQGWTTMNADDSILLVISDIEMPKLDGYGLLQRIRNAESPVRSIPVIVVTGAEDEATRREALSRGATDFVIKPVDGVQLLARVRAQVESQLVARQLAATQETLRDESTLDPLTGLSSRRYFLQRGVQDVAYARRRGQDLAIFRINLDKFKRIYREYGDDGIDRILVWLAKLLEDQARTEDTVSRVGGADFAVLAPTNNPDAAHTLATRLLNAVQSANYQENGKEPLPLTASIGLATLSENAELDIEQLFETSERRVRQARLDGGNRIVAEDRVVAPAAAETDEAPELPDAEEMFPELALEPEPMLAEPDSDSEETGLTLDESLVPNLEMSLEDAELADPAPLEPGTTEETLSIDERILEDALADIAAADAAAGQAMDLNSALDLLANGNTDEIEPHLATLIARIVPLLEAGDQNLNLGIASAIALIRARLQQTNPN